MTAVAFAFGSFGDIFTTAQLLVNVVTVLRNGTHSSERDETEKELKSLWTDIVNLMLIPVDEAIQSSPIARFFQKINASSGLLHKVLGAASGEKELATFRMRVIERRTALGVVVGMLNLGALLAVKDRVNQVAEGAVAIKDRVDQVAQGTRQIRDAVQEGVNGLAEQLANYQQQIVAVIHHVPHGVSAESFVVVSPTGVSIPVPRVYCTTSQDLYRIISAYMGGRHPRPYCSFEVTCGVFVVFGSQPDELHKLIDAGMNLETGIQYYDPTESGFWRVYDTSHTGLPKPSSKGDTRGVDIVQLCQKDLDHLKQLGKNEGDEVKLIRALPGMTAEFATKVEEIKRVLMPDDLAELRIMNRYDPDIVKAEKIARLLPDSKANLAALQEVLRDSAETLRSILPHVKALFSVSDSMRREAEKFHRDFHSYLIKTETVAEVLVSTEAAFEVSYRY